MYNISALKKYYFYTKLWFFVCYLQLGVSVQYLASQVIGMTPLHI